MTCGLIQRHAGAFLDGELDPATHLELERHVERCVECQERLDFERGFRDQVREALSGVAAPTGLRARILASLDEADAHRSPSDEAHPVWERSLASHPSTPLIRAVPVKPRHAIPMAAAAAVLLGLGGALAFAPLGADTGASAASMATLPIFEDVARVHSHELPADVRDADSAALARYFQGKVAFPVRPAEFGRADVRLVGARLSSVMDEGAAVLYYTVGGRRLTVVVFESTELPPDVQRVRVDGDDVYYRVVHGHTIPIRRHAGLSYAFAGDLDQEQLFRLAAASRIRY